MNWKPDGRASSIPRNVAGGLYATLGNEGIVQHGSLQRRDFRSRYLIGLETVPLLLIVVRKREPRSDNRNLRLGEHKPNDAKHGEERRKTTGKPNAV